MPVPLSMAISTINTINENKHEQELMKKDRGRIRKKEKEEEDREEEEEDLTIFKSELLFWRPSHIVLMSFTCGVFLCMVVLCNTAHVCE